MDTRSHPTARCSSLSRPPSPTLRPATRLTRPTLRRAPAGAPQAAEAEGRRPLAVGVADPPNAAHVARWLPRHLGDRAPARGAPTGAARRRPLRRGPRTAGVHAREGARRPDL